MAEPAESVVMNKLRHDEMIPCQLSVKCKTCPDGEIGRRSGLKIRRPQGRGGSSPPPGTNEINHLIFDIDDGNFLFVPKLEPVGSNIF